MFAGGTLASGLPGATQDGGSAARPEGAPPGERRGLLAPREGAQAVGKEAVCVKSDVAGCDGKGIGD